MSDATLHHGAEHAATKHEHPHHHPFLQHHFEDMGQQHEASTLGMWFFVAQEILFFGGLFAAYVVYRYQYPTAFGEGALTSIFLNFPDPWWKAKHKKRRIVSDAFARLLTSRLAPGGALLVQTDVASLLEEYLARVEAQPGVKNPWGRGRLAPKKTVGASSHREQRCRADGVPIVEL